MKSEPLIGVAELEKLLSEPELRILDCRFDLMRPAAGRAQWLEAHIPGAAYADLDKDLAGPIGSNTGRHPLPEAAALSASFGRLGIGNDDRAVVYDSGSGAIAARAWWLLHWLGHDNVALLDGGYAAWEAAGLAVESGESAIETRKFSGVADADMVLTTANVAQGAPVARQNIIDARDAARFRGEVEPIDPKSGHVPGTRNLPFSKALDAAGHWKEGADLRKVWNALPGGPPPSEWAVMCGSGVTACHLVLSAQLAGLSRPRLYAGSWSEWIRDPDRELEVGDQRAFEVQNPAEPA